MADRIEELREKLLAAPSRDRRLPGRPPSVRSPRGEMAREADGEILADLAG